MTRALRPRRVPGCVPDQAPTPPFRNFRNRSARQGVAYGVAGAYSNQSKAARPSVTYMPMTRPVKPAATSVDR